MTREAFRVSKVLSFGMSAINQKISLLATTIFVTGKSVSQKEKAPDVSRASCAVFETEISARGLCPSLPALAGFRMCALVEVTAGSTPACQHIRSKGCSR